MSLEHAVDEQLLLKMVHRLADVDLCNEPAIPSQHLGDNLVELIVVGCIGVSHEGCIVVEDDSFVLEILIVVAEVLSELRQLLVILDIE